MLLVRESKERLPEEEEIEPKRLIASWAAREMELLEEVTLVREIEDLERIGAMMEGSPSVLMERVEEQ